MSYTDSKKNLIFVIQCLKSLFSFSFPAILEASVCVSVIELCEKVAIMIFQGVGGREGDGVSNRFGSIREG